MLKIKLDHILKSKNPKNEIWKQRKKLMHKEADQEYYKDDKGNVINDENELKEYIANYYENLYQARKGKEEYTEWTIKIEDKVKEIML